MVLCVGYRHEQIRDWAGDGKDMGLDIRYSLETEPLGTGGALALAFQRFGGESTFAVTNGDSLAEVGFDEMRRAHLATGASATVALIHSADTARFGRVEIEPSGRVRRFAEKCEDGGPGAISCGFYLFERRALQNIPANRACSLERELLPGLIGRGELFSFPARGKFIDIGTPLDFERAGDFIRQVFQIC